MDKRDKREDLFRKVMLLSDVDRMNFISFVFGYMQDSEDFLNAVERGLWHAENKMKE